MGKIKTGLLAVTGTAVGVITLRRLRGRRSKKRTGDDATEDVDGVEEEVEETAEGVEDATEDVLEAKGEVSTAARHVVGAVKHAGLAVVKAIR